MEPEHSALPDPGSELVVLIPIKDFRQAKHRLAGRLEPDEREALARSMAAKVIAAADGLDVRVVCSDPAVAEWARSCGAGVEWVEVEGLNPAIEAAARQVGRSARQILVCHADLPHARSLHGLARSATVTIVPDRHHEGTNVLVVPADAGFRFQYGPGSLQSHVAEALRLGLDVEIRQIPDLQWDVDTPEDLDGTESRPTAERPHTDGGIR